MALSEYELELQSEVVSWKCSRHVDCLMKFLTKSHHIKLGVSGLVWTIQALPLLGSTGYTFNIMQVKRFRSPLATSRDLPRKFKLLLVGFEMSLKFVFRAEEALDKLYAFSHLLSRAEEDKRWWIIVDAEITAMACNTTIEAIQQAAEATAAILVGHNELPTLENLQQSISGCGISGWWIEQWAVADELWAASFFQEQGETVMKQFQAKAVEEGNVLQWCSLRFLDTPNPWFEFEVRVEKFSEGDRVLLRIGIANDRSLRVRVFLTKDDVKVVCYQEGVESETSLGLRYLLPDLVRDYIRAALERKEADLSKNNVVEGMVQHVVRYLTFLGKLCVVCGSDRWLEVPLSSCCSNICKAGKQGYEAAIAACASNLKGSDRAKRREQYVRKLYRNTGAGRTGLETLLQTSVIEEPWVYSTVAYIGYDDAVERVARMDSTSIATALGIRISKLWSGDM